MEWSTATKNGFNGSEVYMEYGYVFVYNWQNSCQNGVHPSLQKTLG